jgi:hypothetical protein
LPGVFGERLRAQCALAGFDGPLIELGPAFEVGHLLGPQDPGLRAVRPQAQRLAGELDPQAPLLFEGLVDEFLRSLLWGAGRGPGRHPAALRGEECVRLLCRLELLLVEQPLDVGKRALEEPSVGQVGAAPAATRAQAGSLVQQRRQRELNRSSPSIVGILTPAAVRFVPVVAISARSRPRRRPVARRPQAGAAARWQTSDGKLSVRYGQTMFLTARSRRSASP